MDQLRRQYEHLAETLGWTKENFEQAWQSDRSNLIREVHFESAKRVGWTRERFEQKWKEDAEATKDEVEADIKNRTEVETFVGKYRALEHVQELTEKRMVSIKTEEERREVDALIERAYADGTTDEERTRLLIKALLPDESPKNEKAQPLHWAVRFFLILVASIVLIRFVKWVWSW